MSGRKLSSLALALALVPSILIPAHAELFKNLKLDGSIETRSFGIDNETDRKGATDDYRSETNVRMMFGANFDLLDDVHGRLLLDRTPRFGNGASSVTNIEDTLVFDNGYVKVDKVFGAVDLTLGRQFYGDSNDLVIYYGPQGDELLSVTSLDAFRTDASIGGVARFQGLYGKLADTGNVGATSNTDSDLFGGELSTDKVIPLGNLAAYYYTAKIHNVKPPAQGNNTLSVTGIRAGGDILAGLGYQAEYIQNFGRNNTSAVPANNTAYHGNAYFLGVHYGHELDGRPIRAHLEYGRGSDDFRAIAAGRRFGLIWGEHSNFGPSTLNRAQATGLSNLKVVDAGVGISPLAKLGFDFNWYRFRYDANLGGIGTSAGTEYDFIVSWKHSDNVTFDVNAASFQVGDAIRPTGQNSPVTRLGADVSIKY
jgi:hypothetical protein